MWDYTFTTTATTTATIASTTTSTTTTAQNFYITTLNLINYIYSVIYSIEDYLVRLL